jgi:hypothetical protein
MFCFMSIPGMQKVGSENFFRERSRHLPNLGAAPELQSAVVYCLPVPPPLFATQAEITEPVLYKTTRPIPTGPVNGSFTNRLQITA